MSTKDFVTQFDSLFYSRRDVYAEGYPDPGNPSKYRYVTIEQELTHDVLLSHLKGERCVGVYPICPDNTVHWFAIDFDAPKEHDNPFQAALEGAKTQQAILEKAGLYVYLERSRSGSGVHLWGFLERPLPALVVRTALRPLLLPHISFDRIYPLQDEVTPRKPLGNLIALPFFGQAVRHNNGLFLNGSDQSINPRDFVNGVRRNAPAVLEQLAAKAPKVRRQVVTKQGSPTGTSGAVDRVAEKYTGALKMLSPLGCSFMRQCYEQRRTLLEPAWYAAIQQCTMFQNGRDLAHAISRDYKTYNVDEVNAKYDQALQNSVIGCATIRDQFPQLACTSCTCRAPWEVAKRGILEMLDTSTDGIEATGDWMEDLAWIAKVDAGEISDGLKWEDDGLDEYTRLRDGEMIVVGAQPSMGKTQFGIDHALRLARAGTPVVFCSAETGRRTLRLRFLANAAEVDVNALRGVRKGRRLTAQEIERLKRAAHELQELPLYFDYCALNPDALLGHVERMLLEFQLPLDSRYVVFFDYLQFGASSAPGDKEYDRLSNLSKGFKFLTKILNRPVVVLSQARRDTEGEEVPDITWCRGSGHIDHDADIIIIIVGERTAGAMAPRSAYVVKQKEGQANVKIDYVVHQGTGQWEESRVRVHEPPPALVMTSQDVGFGES